MSKLCFKENNRFRIIQMTDLHIGSLPHHSDDLKTFALIDKAISKLDPDFIALTGDQIWSDGVKDLPTIYRELLDRIAAHEKPFALCYGNHDAEGSLSRADLRVIEDAVAMQIEKQHAFYCEERENFALEIYSQDASEVKNVLYFMDSGQDAPLPIGTYDWLRFEQVEWFRETSAKYAGRGKRDLVFMHIPLPEYWRAAENIVDGVCLETNEMISAPHLNTGFFAAAYISGQVDAIFAGHDHDNNFVGVHEGIKLCYGQITGYQCYGQLPCGVRIIDLFDDGRPMQTWTITDDEIK